MSENHTLLALTRATLLDVDAGRYEADRTIVVAGDRIIAVGGPDTEIPANARTVNLRGAHVLPGLIDSHVHVSAVTADLSAQAEWSASYVAARTGGILRDMLGRGFTTVRDAAGADYGLAAAVEEGYFAGPRIHFAGKSLSQTGGHADLRHRGRTSMPLHRCCPSIGVVCDGVPEVRRAAREQLRTGAHHLKIMLSGGVASPTDRIDSTQFSMDEIRAVVEEARAANRYVAGHAYTARAINRGLEAGVRSIEHGNLLDDRSIELFKEHGAFYVPTLVTYQALSHEGVEHGLPSESEGKVAEVMEHGLRALERAHRGGVDIAFGSDLLGGMHRHQLEEFRIRSEVQPVLDIIRSATTVGARLLGLEGEVGVVAEGAYADLLVLDADPLDDVNVLVNSPSHQVLLMQAGRLHVDRTAA